MMRPFFCVGRSICFFPNKNGSGGESHPEPSIREKTSRRRNYFLAAFFLAAFFFAAFLGAAFFAAFFAVFFAAFLAAAIVHSPRDDVVFAPQRRLYYRDAIAVHNRMSFTRLSLRVFLNLFV
jgi:hypothetical protein